MQKIIWSISSIVLLLPVFLFSQGTNLVPSGKEKKQKGGDFIFIITDRLGNLIQQLHKFF
jgi:hypothetical protein